MIDTPIRRGNAGPTFTIESTGAPLVEVSGSGPYTDRADGVGVGAGASKIAPVSLLGGAVRAWRVDAAPGVQTTVRVKQSPYGALLSLRRCEGRMAGCGARCGS